MAKKEIVIDERRDFKGVWIPKKLYLCRELNANHKFVLLEIYSLSKNGECYASNSHFADFVGLSSSSVDKIIAKLKSLDLIKSVVVRNPETQEVERRVISLTKNFYDKYINESTENLENKPNRNFLNQGGRKNCEEKYNNTINTINYSSTELMECGYSFDREIIAKAKSITDEECLINAIAYYLKKYREHWGYNHSNISINNLMEFVSNIEYLFDGAYEELREDNGLIKIIDRHFNYKYKQKTDYKFQHFASRYILEYHARYFGYIDGYKD